MLKSQNKLGEGDKELIRELFGKEGNNGEEGGLDQAEKMEKLK